MSTVEEDNMQDDNQDTNLKDKKNVIEILSSVIILVAAALQGLGESMQAYVADGGISEEEVKERLLNEINERNIGISKLVQSGGAGEVSTIQQYSAQQALNAPVTNVTGAAETVNALLKIGKLTKDVAGSTISKIASESYELSKNLLGVAINKLETSVLGQNLVNLPGDTTADKLNNLSALINEIAQDPESRQALTELSRSVANLGIQTLDTIQPELDELTNKFWTVVNNIASKSAVSALTVATSTIMAVIADIPVIGGIIVDMFLAAKTFNNLVITGAEASKGISEVIKEGVKTISTTAGVISENATPVVQAAQNAQTAISDTINKVSNLQLPEAPEIRTPGIPIYSQTAGSADRKEKIENIKKRIKRTIKNFKGEKIIKKFKNKSRKRINK